MGAFFCVDATDHWHASRIATISRIRWNQMRRHALSRINVSIVVAFCDVFPLPY
jgi:hypothetical protein